MKVLIVDDHALIRVYLKHYIEEHFPRFEVSVIQKITPTLPEDIIDINPQIVVLDISLDILDTLDFFKHLKSKLPGALFIIYTMHNISSYKKFFLAHGAQAYVLKENAQAELSDIIEAVLDGKTVFPKEFDLPLTDYNLNQLNFSDLEKKLLSALLETLDTDEISKLLELSASDILNVKLSLLEKTGAKNTQQLVSYAIDYNWIR
jgi:DNA-binding NarL/FixJ family response regulator